MISIAAAVQAVIILIVAGLIFWACSWLIDYVGVPEPFHKVCRVILAVAAVLVVIGVLLSFAGVPTFRP